MKEQILIDFGRRLKDLRLSQNLTQEDLAEKSGLHKNYIGMVERGERNPSLVNISLISKSLKNDLSELLKGL
jgi:transcriptional regulator with XRE-family HTH domain